MQKLLFLQPVFHEKIWGGKKLKDHFNYSIPSDHTGECWAISAHQNGDCVIKNGAFKGEHLSKIYQKHPELFNHCKSPRFPLLTKILDANNDLSVQVHPDDNYALEHDNEFGKNECWYIIDCDTDATMIYGHHAKSKEELVQLIEENKWNHLIRQVKIKPGEFYYVPTGTIHALCKGTLVLETQQASDTTYRVYDYDRKDQHHQKRPLHIDKAIEVTTVPHKDFLIQKEVRMIKDSMITTFLKTPNFTVQKWDVKNEIKCEIDTFLLVSVLNGNGKFLDEPIQKGDHFIVTSINNEVFCQGNLELLVSSL